MPNKYTRETDRVTASVEIYDLAFKEVRLRGKSLRDAAVLTSTAETPVLNNNTIKPIASTSTAPSPLATVSNVFSPESVRPLPRVLPRKKSQPNRCKMKSTVITDAPTKDEIAAVEDNRKRLTKHVKKRVFSKGKKKLKNYKKTTKKKRTSGDAEEAKIIVFAWFALKPMQRVDRMSSGLGLMPRMKRLGTRRLYWRRDA